MRVALTLLAVSATAACSGGSLGGSRDSGADTGGMTGTTGTAGAGGAGTAGATGTAGAAGSIGAAESVTEWLIPFTDSQPFQIAAVGTSVFYLTAAYDQNLGRLDIEQNTVTEWPLSHPGTSPGDIEIRPSDGAVFVTGGSVGEIGQFDPQTQVLRRWVLPLDVPASSSPGPWSLAFDTSGRVIFSAQDANGSVIGRLDTVSGGLDVWDVPDGSPTNVGVAPDGTIVFPIGGPSSPFQIMRLDPATGIFTAWQLVDQPLFGSVLDPAGNFFFTQYSSIYGVTRLTPATGRLTTWATPDLLNSESMVLLSGHVFVGSELSTALEALDPSAAGQDAILPPLFYEAVSSRSLVVTPTTETLSGQEAPAEVTPRTVQRQTVGAFVTWPLPGTPRMLATVPGAVYYTDESEPVIARLVLAPL